MEQADSELTIPQVQSVDPFTAAPGKRTSEFYATIISSALTTVLAVLALFSPGFTIDPDTQKLIVTTLSGGAVLGTAVYTWGRALVKREAAKAAAAAAIAQVSAQTLDQPTK